MDNNILLFIAVLAGPVTTLIWSAFIQEKIYKSGFAKRVGLLLPSQIPYLIIIVFFVLLMGKLNPNAGLALMIAPAAGMLGFILSFATILVLAAFTRRDTK